MDQRKAVHLNGERNGKALVFSNRAVRPTKSAHRLDPDWLEQADKPTTPARFVGGSPVPSP